MGKSNIEWLGEHLRAKTQNFDNEIVSGGKKDIAPWEIRCACFSKIETKLAKALASLYTWQHKDKDAYLYVLDHLAKIMIKEAQIQNLEPKIKSISLEEMAILQARMVLEFELNPELENVYTSYGRIYFAGIAAHGMKYDAYRKTWMKFEKLMLVAIVNAEWEIEKAVGEYRRNLNIQEAW